MLKQKERYETMKINAINSNYMTGNLNFGRSAVPYPEYPAGYSNTGRSVSFTHTAEAYPEYAHLSCAQDTEGYIGRIKNRLYSLFSPEVTRRSQEIKKNINSIYEADEKKRFSKLETPETQLLAVLA